jgi:hypothetical protein
MDDALLDETAVRDLLDLVASDDAPPSRVNVDLARRQGRRRRRLHRVYLPGAAPVAAAAAVGLIVSLTAGLPGTQLPSRKPPAGRSERTAQITAPSRFSLFVPYASFGWLPPGFSADTVPPDLGGMGVGGTQSALVETVGAPSRQADGKDLSLQVNAAGSCKLTDAGGHGLTSTEARRYIRQRAAQLHPLSLSCTYLPLASAAPNVKGHPAFWDVRGDLIWEYGRDAWAELTPSTLLIEPHLDPHFDGWYNVAALARSAHGQGHPAYRQSAATRALLVKVADSVHYGGTTPQFYAFALSSVPAGWRSAVIPTSFQAADGRLVNTGWQVGPASDPSGLSISVTPAAWGGRYSCKFFSGQSRYVTADGARGLLRTIDEPGKHEQSLCIADVHGLSIFIDLDLRLPGTNDSALPGSKELHSALAVLSHLQLLGPSPARWTTSPLR